jgi:hypothetical protein
MCISQMIDTHISILPDKTYCSHNFTFNSMQLLLFNPTTEYSQTRKFTRNLYTELVQPTISAKILTTFIHITHMIIIRYYSDHFKTIPDFHNNKTTPRTGQTLK